MLCKLHWLSSIVLLVLHMTDMASKCDALTTCSRMGDHIEWFKMPHGSATTPDQVE